MASEVGPPDKSIRASDAEREAAVDRLREAGGEGRLTLEELAERSEAAYAAVGRSDLTQLLADLPAAGTRVTSNDAQAARPVAPARRRTLWGVMGGDTLEGPMHLGDEMRIINVMGGVDLDLSQAVLGEGALTLRIYSLMGGTTIRVPQGVHVEGSGFSLMGGDSIEAAENPPAAGAPVIHLRSINVMGGNDVKRGPRRSRRWSWQHRLGEGESR